MRAGNARREISSFVPGASSSYLATVEEETNTNRKDGNSMKHFRMPSAAELYAYEQLARRERAKAQAELIRAGFSWLKQTFVTVFTKPYAVRTSTKVMRHA
jgi:hypothetical protein